MIQSHRVTTEGDELYYEVRGQGQPLLLIPPAGGDGWQYSFVADILADEYKVITYDRRANARSTMNDPQNFEISQQSRDALALSGTPSSFTAPRGALRLPALRQGCACLPSSLPRLPAASAGKSTARARLAASSRLPSPAS
jgi:pimeloyl-ACP methyl ester carboxylesterase